jgi:tRNA uridine 5-carboxymethylaminomethyl modification enzyme
MNNIYDILVVGGGHAGVEAAWISSQMKLNICLVSSPDSGLASAPCNPAIGGVGKGQVVREIDALGGLMGKLADFAGIQYRTLNESKGYAVQSTRVQIDKNIYSEKAEEILAGVSNLTIVREIVESIHKPNELFTITTKSGKILFCKKLILTTGTFLSAKMHVGTDQIDGGRVGCEKSEGLSTLFSEVKLEGMRFKTGTPPRILNTSIDYSKLQEQASDDCTRNFSSLAEPFIRNSKQVSCFLANTNSKTLSIIRANKEKSPIFNGQIKGVGPRYCPSIEDKAFRYEDKDVHHVFIEPEGLNLNTIYPNGLSTSLPKDVQEQFISSIVGLEQSKILVYGYAVEYDVIDTSYLKRTLEHKLVGGLYFAGQVCGTSGYEEAAGQGIMAGINAAFSIKEFLPMVLSRTESYIGVMVEDLVLNKRDEPYRLFTARSENRLFIREDNTLQRMQKYRSTMQLNSKLDIYQSEFLEELEILNNIIASTIYYNTEKNQNYFANCGYGQLEINVSLAELVKRGSLDPVHTLRAELLNFGCNFSNDVIYTAAIGVKYEGYINRSIIESEKFNKLANKKIDLDLLLASNQISFECKSRIRSFRPENFGQLQKIEGIRPATLAFVAGNIL